MIREDTREKTLAVLFSAIMVLSVFGAGFAGTAAAAADSPTLDDSTVQSGTQVTVSATAGSPGNDVTFAVDADGNGTIESDEHIATVSSNETSGNASVSFTPSDYSIGENTVTVYTVEETNTDGTDDTSYPVSNPSSIYEGQASLTVDDTAPSYQGASPTGTVTDNRTAFSVNITDTDGSGVNASSISVTVTDSAGNTLFENANPGEAGVEFASNELTVTPQSDYAEGPVTVNVSAADNADNVNDLNSEFTVDAVTTVESSTVAETPINVSNNNGQDRQIELVFDDPMQSVDRVEILDFTDASGDVLSKDVSSSGSLNADNVTWTGNFSEEADSGLEESITVQVEATDQNGDSLDPATTEFTFDVDTQPPNVTADTSDTISGDSYDVTTEFTLQNAADADVTYEYDAGDGYEEISSSANFNTSNVSDGQIDLRATAVDDAGNEDSDTGSTVVDNDAPNVTTDLTVDEVLTGTVDLSTRFTAENVDGNPVGYYVDANDDGNFTSVSTSFDTETIDDGGAVLRANASDDAGTEDSATQTVVVDNTAPDNLTVDSPTDPVFQNVGDFELNYSYTEVNPDEEQIVLSADGEEDVVFNFTGVGGSGEIERNRTLDLTSPDDGNITNATYNVSVEVTDVTGEQSDSTTETDLVTVDDIEPGDINIVEPSAEQIVESGDVLTVAYNYVEDNTESVTVTLDNGDETYTYDIDDSQYQNTGIRKTVNLALDENNENMDTLVDGSYNVTVEVTDAAGNVNSSTTDEAYVVVNDDAPVVTTDGVNPSEDVAPDASVDVDYTVSDNVNTSEVRVWVFETNEDGEFYNASSEEYLTDYGIYSYDVDQAPGSYTETVDLSAAPAESNGDFSVTDNDDYEVVVEAIDETGKDGVDLTNSVTLDVNENAPTVTDVQANAGTDTVTVDFSEPVEGADGGIDQTDFAYQDVSGVGPTEVTGVTEIDSTTVELTLDADVDGDNLGNDTISVTQNSIVDSHPNDQRAVDSGVDYALEDDALLNFDVDTETVALDNVEAYDATVTPDENVDVEVEAVGPNGTTVTENATGLSASMASDVTLNLSDLEDGNVEMTVTVTDEGGNSDSVTVTELKDTDQPGLESVESDADTQSVYVTFDESVNVPDSGDFTLNGIDANVIDVEADGSEYELELDGFVPASAFDESAPANVSADGVTDVNGNAFDGEAVNVSDRNEPEVEFAISSNGTDTVDVYFTESVYNASGDALSADDFTYVNNSGVSHHVDSVDHVAGNSFAEVTLDSTLTPDDLNSDELEVTANDSVDKQTTTSTVIFETVDIDDFEVTNASDASERKVNVSFTADEELDSFNVSLSSTHDLSESDEDDAIAEGIDLDESDFEVEEDGGVYTYTSEQTVPRDGEFTAELTSATAVGGADAFETPFDTTYVDMQDPNVVDAEIVGAGLFEDDTSGTAIAVQFDEPVFVTGDFEEYGVTLDGESLTERGIYGEDSSQGTVYFEVEGHTPTGDAPSLSVTGDAVEERHSLGVDDTVDANSSTTLDTQEYQISEGVNFVSVPAEFGSLDISSSEFADMTVMTYEDGEWLTYAPDRDAENQGIESMEGGQGYVVTTDSDTTVDVTVRNEEPGDTAADATPGQQQLQEGWNLVGHWQEGIQPAEDGPGGALDSVGGDSTATNVYGQATDGEFGYTPVDLFEPGEAYWVFVEDDEIYTVSSYGYPVA